MLPSGLTRPQKVQYWNCPKNLYSRPVEFRLSMFYHNPCRNQINSKSTPPPTKLPRPTVAAAGYSHLAIALFGSRTAFCPSLATGYSPLAAAILIANLVDQATSHLIEKKQHRQSLIANFSHFLLCRFRIPPPAPPPVSAGSQDLDPTMK